MFNSWEKAIFQKFECEHIYFFFINTVPSGTILKKYLFGCRSMGVLYWMCCGKFTRF